MEKVNVFFAKCFFALVMSMYTNVFLGNAMGYAGLTGILMGIILGFLLLDLIKFGYQKLKANRRSGENVFTIDVKDIVVGGFPMRETTIVIPDFLKEKMFKGLSEAFGIQKENIILMGCDKDNHSKFQFILTEYQAESMEKGIMGMYRNMTGLDKISYN